MKFYIDELKGINDSKCKDIQWICYEIIIIDISDQLLYLEEF